MVMKTICMCQDPTMEGTLLTREQVEEISTRISNTVSEYVTKHLETAIAKSVNEK